MANTQDLQDLVARGGIVTLPRETFCVDTPIVVTSGTVIEGSGAVIATQLDDRHTFLVHGCRDVCVRNLDIQGSWSPTSGDVASVGAAIRVEASHRVLIENVAISGMMGRGIVATPNVHHLTIGHCHIYDCAISVFLFKGARWSMIESNRIFDSRLIGIYVDDAAEGDTQETAVPNHCTIIRGNIIEYGGTSPRNTGFGIAVSGSADTIISDNIIRSFGNETRIAHGIVLNNGQGGFSQGRRTVVSDNILSGHSGYGLYSVGQYGCTVYGNIFDENGLGNCKVIGGEA